MKCYSIDFRKCVIEKYKNGLPRQEIIELFGIGLRTLNRWIRMYQDTKDLQPKQKTKHRTRKFSDEDLLDYIEKNPSATLEEIAEFFSVKAQSIWQRLKLLNVTLKKKRLFILKEMKKKGKNSGNY